MPLLPGGERGPPLLQLAFAAVVLWLGWQGFLNVLRYQAVSGNIATLSAELNHDGVSEYRRQLMRILELDSSAVAEEDIHIQLDPEKDQYQVTVRSKWTLDVPWLLHFERPCVHRFKVGRSSVLNHRG